MRPRGRGAILCYLAFLALGWACLAVAQEQDSADRFMGDWVGEAVDAQGNATPVAAQVMALGAAQYRANLLAEFDTRQAPLAVLDGTARDGAVYFGDQAVISGEQFEGALPGGERFAMTRTVRLSPTLESEPPEGAVVLLGAGNLDQWTHPHWRPWVVDLRREIGGENRVAYLRNRLWSPAEQDAVLEIGSDDGVKVWLNAEVVHANNVPRGLSPGQDKVGVKLLEGWNSLLLKVAQGGGDWGACVRIASPDGPPLSSVVAEHGPDGVNQLPGAQGYVITWEISGPFVEEGKNGTAVFDVVFPPETDEQSQVEWRLVNQQPVSAGVRWALLPDGSMEVAPGTGAVAARLELRDHLLHLEFRTPFMPSERGQGRGNSGVYVQGRYEVQVLDSYGLEGADNECGGIYKIGAPRVNMCAPPLQWQTYDIVFRAARFAEPGNKTEDARITVLHNGVPIHEGLSMPGPTGGALDYDESAPGALYLQDHGNRVQYRNAWIVEE